MAGRKGTRIAKDLAFWAAVGFTGVAAVGLFKVVVARIPGPDGLNRFAAAL